MFPFLASITFPTKCRFVIRTSLEGVNVEVVPNVVEEELPIGDVPDDQLSTRSSVPSFSKETFSDSPKVKSARSRDSLTSQSPRRTPRSVTPAKSSPRATPPVPASVPSQAATRASAMRKALEVSPGMLEFFGGGPSYGADACFSKIPPQPTDQGRFGRKNLLERESREESPFRSTCNQVSSNTLPAFQPIDNHDARYESCKKNLKWNSSASSFNFVPQCSAPGPDLGEDEEEQRPAEDAKELQTCPVTTISDNQFKQLSMRCNLENGGKSPIEESDWRDAAEDVLRTTGSTVTEDPADSAAQRSGRNKKLRSGLDRTGSSLLDVPGPEIASDSEEQHEDERAEEPFAEDRAWSAAGEAAKKSSPDEAAAATTAAATTRDDEKSMTPERQEEAGSPCQTNGDQNNPDTHDAGHQMRDGTTMPVSANASRGAGGFGELPILIRGGQIVNDDAIFSADVLVEDRVIRQVSTSIPPPPNAIIIEAAGKMVLPAGIDVHTDFATAGSVDDFSLGTKAALAGGTTTVIDVVIPELASESLVAAFDRVKGLAEAKSHCNLALSVCVNRWSDAVKQEMKQLVERGANSFILDLNNDSDLFQAFEQCKSLGAHARILPENKNVVSLLEKRMLQMGIDGPEGYIQSRPAFLEGEQVHRMCVLSQLTNCPFSVLSVTSSQSCRAVAVGRSSGSLVNAEIAVGAFATEPNAYFDKDIKKASSLLLAAPVRTEAKNVDDLMDLMANSPLCVCVSDHRAIKSADRVSCSDFTKMPRGCSAAEERLSVLWEKAVYSGLVDPMRFVAITSSNAAKIFNLYPKKGRIAVGADADIVVWNPKGNQQLSAKEHWSSADVNVFEGLMVHATPSATICEGRLVYQDGKMNIASKGNMGSGRFINLQPNSPHVFGVVQARERMNTPDKVERAKVETKRNDFSDSRPITGTGARGHVEGARSQFESSFSVSGAGDNTKSRASIKMVYPPGGKASGLW
ncbi:hypothetical protein L596_004911 [Steinernema carpocapsae]|uniref:Amidohydrolase-related domain-containing protein n=1 Tax=Steinernema carpocapsae TaxID=34508 RepID=A0A4U8UYS9_STECR|nr:hypothetical protein L596_004911 [Steinernema carpocapsae]